MNKRAAVIVSAIAVFASMLCCRCCHAQRGELWGQRASLFEMLGTDSTSIVFLGNSLTHGCEWHELFGNPHIVNRGINGDVVDGFLADHPELVPEPFDLPHWGKQPGQLTLWPHIHDTDGFFVAKLRRKGQTP